MTTRCRNCHTCGTRLIPVLDGEEWCKTCGAYRRYRSHGWSAAVGEASPCPAPAAEYATVNLDSAEGDHTADRLIALNPTRWKQYTEATDGKER